MSELVERLREVQGLLDRRTMFESAETVALAIEALEAKEAVGQCEPTRYYIEHDGFVGTVIGRYTRLDGKAGVVMQQDGTNVVHVYGAKWLKPAGPLPSPSNPTKSHNQRG